MKFGSFVKKSKNSRIRALNNERIDSFIMTITSFKQFEKILLSYKQSKYWNIRNTLFIMNHSNNSCIDAINIFKITSSEDLINSYLLCFDSKLMPMIYTCNPFTNRAPDSWKDVKLMPGEHTQWTLYFRLYLKGKI